MKQIIVEPDRLDDTAAKIEQANQEYEHIYKSLYNEVDKMSGAWSGKDNLAYSNQIKSYEDNFRQISITMRQYADFLRSSARSYRETQDELTNQAARLRV